MKHLLVLTTCPDADSADALAGVLVEQRLAACVNIIPGLRSIYEWQGKLCKEQEFVLLVKSRGDRLAELEAAILAHHPYELPEVIALPIEAGLAKYLNWIDQQLDSPR